MKNLNKYIQESLLDDEGDLINDTSLEDIQWVKDNYNIYSAGRNGTTEFIIKNGILNAPSTGFSAKKRLSELTNGLFKFGEVGEFDCSSCPWLKSLNGGPIKTKANFSTVNCASLKNLKGAPEHVGAEFDCSDCESLESLKGAPEYIGTDFIFRNCKKLKSIKGFPKTINGDVYFDGCSNLSKTECDKLMDLI